MCNCGVGNQMDRFPLVSLANQAKQNGGPSRAQLEHSLFPQISSYGDIVEKTVARQTREVWAIVGMSSEIL